MGLITVTESREGDKQLADSCTVHLCELQGGDVMMHMQVHIVMRCGCWCLLNTYPLTCP